MNKTGLALSLLLTLSLPVLGADGHREERVQFKAGSQGATVKGRVAGRDDVDYLLGAKAGQRMSVTLRTDHPQLYFNVLPPGSEEALFVGSSSGGTFEDELPRSGDYRIRVYLMRAAARRDESASYRLNIRIDGVQRSHSEDIGEDFADGYAGGPDFWQVTGLQRGDTLNVRRGPSAGERVVDELDEGDVVRNLGCKPVAGQRWCRVARPDDARTQGWVAGHYLRESSDQP
jgi:hypothetical protein